MLRAVTGQHVAEFEAAGDRGAAAVGDLDRVADVVLVAVGQGDVGRGQTRGGDPGGLRERVAGDERIHEHGVGAVGDREGGVSEEGDGRHGFGFRRRE